MLSHVSHHHIQSRALLRWLQTLPYFAQVALQGVRVVNISKFVQLGQVRILPLEALLLLELNLVVDEFLDLFVVLLFYALQFQFMLLQFGLLFETGNLVVLRVDQFFRVKYLHCFAHCLCKASIGVVLVLNAGVQIFQIVVKQWRNKVVVAVVQRGCDPACRLQVSFVERIQVLLHLFVRLSLRLFNRLFKLCQRVFIPLLLILDKCLVLHGCLKVHHVLTNDGLHLHGVEVLLVVQHIAHRLLVIFNLLKLYEQHVVQLFKVLLHVVDSDTTRELEENSVKTTVELSLHFANLAVILFVGLGVLLEPELGVGDGLVHASLQVFVSSGLSGHLCLHVRGLLGQVCLGA